MPPMIEFPLNLKRVRQFPAACCGSESLFSFFIPRSLLREWLIGTEGHVEILY